MTTKNFAELDTDNTVIRVLSISESDSPTEDAGKQFLNNLFGGNWIETSYEGIFRKRFASVGGKYNVENNVFIDPKPYSNWILNSDFEWIPPVQYPVDGKIYRWDVESVSWIEHDYCCENCEEEAQQTPAFPVSAPFRY
jgi:hypothetical protein